MPSPTHSSAREDVGTVAALAQSDESGGGEGEGGRGLMELLCPFQLLYGDGVERLAAESARERVRWVSAIWCVFHSFFFWRKDANKFWVFFVCVGKRSTDQ